jgi:hypothetical protein
MTVRCSDRHSARVGRLRLGFHCAGPALDTNVGHTMRYRMPVRALSLLLGLTVACGGRSSDAEPCPAAGVAERACRIELSRDAGTLRVPAGTAIEPLGANPEGRHLVLPDSAVAEVWVTEYPADGLAASGDARIDSVQHADTLFAGRSTQLVSLRMVPSSGAPVCAGLAYLTVDSARAVNFWIQTASGSSRDRALREIVGALAPRVSDNDRRPGG